MSSKNHEQCSATPNPYADDQMISFGWTVTPDTRVIPFGMSIQFLARSVSELIRDGKFNRTEAFEQVRRVGVGAYAEALWAASQAGRFLGPNGRVYRVVEAPELTAEVIEELGVETGEEAV